jgi:Uma2 family endonuclease
MASTASAAELMTVDTFNAIVGDGQKADLIDGVIYMASPDTVENDQIASCLHTVLRSYVEKRDLGRVFGSRFAFVLSKHRAPEPDVAFVRRERLHLVGRHGMEGGPDVAVEVVSRDSRDRDYGDKKRLYLDAGVEEYWLVDPLQRRAEFYRLSGDLYEMVPLEANRIFRSVAVRGFWLDVDWLFTEPPVKAVEKLQEILGA